MCDDDVGVTVGGEATGVHQEPALLVGGVTRVLQLKRVALPVENRAKPSGSPCGVLVVGRLRDVEVVLPDRIHGPLDVVELAELLPRAVRGNDHAVGVENRQIERQGVERLPREVSREIHDVP